MLPTSRSPNWKKFASVKNANSAVLPARNRLLGQAQAAHSHSKAGHSGLSEAPHATRIVISVKQPQSCRSTIAFFNTAISFAGLRPFGQAFEQFMMVWQR